MATRRQGSIRKLGDDRWLVRWYAGQKDGKREYSAKVVRGTKDQAQKQLNEQLHSLARGVYVRPTKETLAAFLNRWEVDVAARASEKTVAVYTGLLAKHVRPVLGAVELQKLDTRAVQELVNGMSERAGRKLSAKTQREAFRVLRQALAKAVRWGLILRNPTDHVDLPRGQAREKRALTAEEIRRFREAARGTHHALVWDVMLASGMRPGEVVGLRWQDVDFEAGVVRVRQAVTEGSDRVPFLGVPKTPKSRRTISLPPSVMAALRRHRAEQARRALRTGTRPDRDTALVFTTRTGGLIGHRTLRKAYMATCTAAAQIEGVRGPYDLRHTAATLLIEAGVPIKAVSERLGHASVAITLGVYVHTTPAQHDQATAVLGALVE